MRVCSQAALSAQEALPGVSVTGRGMEGTRRIIDLLFSCFLCSAGGLVTAVAPVVIGCDGLWVGWSGLMDGNSDVEIPESSEGYCLRFHPCFLIN